MKVLSTPLPGVLVVEPRVFDDARGFFMETHSQKRYAEHGIAKEGFVQDNLSQSTRGVLRGLHFQNPVRQGKLVYVLHGEVFDVAVDIRWGSPTFALWFGEYLSGENKKQLYIPPGFAHGFQVISDSVLFSYKCTDYYSPENEGSVAWNDPQIRIEWPLAKPILSQKDGQAPTLAEIDPRNLPTYNAAYSVETDR